MKTRFLIIMIILCFLPENKAVAQDYAPVAVTVSRDKVMNAAGEVFYAHVVLEKQTLFAISKAYGVSIDAICAANPTLDLKRQGLKKGTILNIPTTGSGPKTGDTATVDKNAPVQESHLQEPEKETVADRSNQTIDYVYHIVKWYEGLEDIAQKYDTTVEAIKQANGLKSNKVKTRTKLRIPVGVKTLPSEEPAQVEPEPAQAEEEAVSEPQEENRESGFFGNLFNFGHKETVNVSLLLPYKADSQPDNSSFDFYSGFLMGVEECGRDGISVDLSTFDIAGGKVAQAEPRIRQSDIVVGPLGKDDLSSVLDMAPASTLVISPLDHRAENLVADHANFIQIPTSVASQHRDLIEWLSGDFSYQDKVIVISEKGAAASAGTASLQNKISASTLPVSRISYGILEGRNAVFSIEKVMTQTGTNRVIIASESEAFVNDVVRNLNLLVYKNFDVVLYSPSKIRSFETIEIENLHKLNTHVATGYYIDFGSEKVKSFLMKYRALFGTEPSQFAFQGYDIAAYFIANCGKGRFTPDFGLDNGSWCRMLQSDFSFKRQWDGGLVNTGIRRIVYNSDFSIRLMD